MEITKTLADFIVGFSYENVNSTLLNKVKMHLLGTLGCMLAGSREEASKLEFNRVLKNKLEREFFLAG